jgi:hypothetical protein
MIKYTFKEAIDLIGNGATYRTVNYYKDIYVNDVYKVEGRYFVSDGFINKVIKNRLTVKKTISEPRTKQDLLNEIEILKEVIADYENSEVFEKAQEGLRVEVFSQDEYNLFNERLIEWRIQRKEIEMTRVHFETVKDERDFIKLQLDYFKQSNDKILHQHEKLIELIGQRNRIEAVEKGVVPKEPYDVD